MPLFEYRCPVGHSRVITDRTDAILCGSDCSEIARRRFSFSIVRSVPEHFNNATGTYVNNERQMKDTLARQAEDQSRRLNTDITYEYLSPADMAESAARGVNNEGMEETYRRKHDSWVAGHAPEPLVIP